ncbi:MAG: carbohydrate kinase, partial [Pseudomonadota bacterium]
MTAKLWFLGEALIDFVPLEAGGETTFAPRCGGSPYNAAKAAALAGGRAAFLGAISTDLFGDMLAADLAAHGVDADHAPRRPEATTLAFVSLASGDPRYAFFNACTATSEMAPGPFPGGPADVLHVGSISLIDPPGGDNVARFAEAVAAGATLSLDPNARPGMIADAPAWRTRIERLGTRAGIVKVSAEDIAFLAPGTAPRDFAEAQVRRGSDVVVVTRGEDGALAATRDGLIDLPGYPIRVDDTVGAGDTVTGYLLAGLAARGLTGRGALGGLGATTLRP